MNIASDVQEYMYDNGIHIQTKIAVKIVVLIKAGK